MFFLKKENRVFLLAILFSVSAYSDLSANDETKGDITRYHYDIKLGGKIVGTLQRHRIESEEGMKILDFSAVEFSGWWGSTTVDTLSFERFDQGGLLAKADVLSWDQESLYWSESQIENGVVSGRYREKRIESGSDRSLLQKLFRPSEQFLQKKMSPVQAIVNKLEVDFSESEPFAVIGAEIDTTISALPDYWKANRFNMPEEFSLLDHESLEI